MSTNLRDIGREPSIYSTTYEVAERLARLGISRRPLESAALQGDLQRRLCTRDDFCATPGYVTWGRALRVVREELRREHAWHQGDFLRIPVCFNTAENVAITVALGDKWTGIDGEEQPSTRKRGQATVEAVELSGTQRSMDFDDDDAVDFWYLLVYAIDDELRAELSKPTDMNDTGQINKWNERILLGSIDPDASMTQKLNEPLVTEPEIAVDVRRKLA